ncbi:MAG: hypothetical protein N2Z81_03925 [Hydrogenothermaceae bacterium]|nr:hypothetical protein [Hydrogenothermaceae bacterium]
MYLGVEYLKSNLFLTSIMDDNAKVIQLSQYTYEGLLHLLDHRDISVISFNYDFNVKFGSSLSNRVVKNISSKLFEYFDYRVVESRNDSYEKAIIYSDVEEFFRKVIRKDLIDEDTPEGLEQRIYNLPKTGIKLNRNWISKDRKVAVKQLNAVILSFAAYSYGVRNFDFITDENSFYIIPKYRYISKAKREQEELSNNST